MLEVALQIVQDLDLPVFPCKEFIDREKGKISKAPYIRRGFLKATKDIEQIRQWWSQWPRALVGVPTGIETNLFVIDIDNDGEKNGEASFASLGLDDPITCQTLTVSGGRHIIFSYPAQVMLKNTTNNLGQHIDTRGEGGYVIWAGSQTVQGSYRYREGFSPEENGFQPLPDNILDLLTKNKKASHAMREIIQNPIMGKGIILSSMKRWHYLIVGFQMRGLPFIFNKGTMIVQNLLVRKNLMGSLIAQLATELLPIYHSRIWVTVNALLEIIMIRQCSAVIKRHGMCGAVKFGSKIKLLLSN
jgi:hypothetical protein